MTELVVVSGKGGTGKTSLVGSLAVLARNKVMVDCDVDAADLHLILRPELEMTTDFIGGKQAAIDGTKCTGCGECVEYCRFDAIKPSTSPATDDKFTVDPFACDGCGVCTRHCPEDAISFNDVISGQWFQSTTAYGPLVHARLGLAQANSGKLVSLLRQRARSLAEQSHAELVIIDGPPGIGCPVIASTTGASYVMIVTEPSLSAIHDMERLLKLTRHFGIPTGICINKADINLDLTLKIEGLAIKEGVSVLGKIPFDSSVTHAQLAHSTVVENSMGLASVAIGRLWEVLRNKLQCLSKASNQITTIEMDRSNKESQK